MHRVLVAVSLALCACLSAGCGEASLRKTSARPVVQLEASLHQVSARPAVQQAARDYSKQWWGDDHPTVVHVQIVRLAYGAQAEVIELSGHFTIHPICMAPIPASRCHTERPRHLVAALDLLNPKYPLGDESTTVAQLARIARARHARPEFKIFPEFANDGIEGVRCAIPRGGRIGGVVAGICLTQDSPNSAYRRPEDPPFTHPRQVEFIELWPLSRLHDRSEAAWTVTFGRSGQIQSIRVTGNPPQLEK